jgi:pyruvate dehydrogenase E2 component (dihydrolipoamide acetyltransferase)
MRELVMPRLSDSMEEATVVEWLKRVGDEIAVGEEIAMIETDKATVPYEATEAGTLREILVAAGETVALGAALARIGGADDPAPAPAAPRRAKASPVARRIAGEHGIDLLAIQGRGPHGRIVKADLQALLEAAATRPAAEPVPVAAAAVVERSNGGAGAKGETVERELTRLQRVVARRMAESKATVPDFVLRTEVDMEACVALRARLKTIAGDSVPSYNDMVLKACGLALREFPVANGSFQDGRLVLHGRVNVGVAVAGEEALVVPTVFDADARSLAEIARTTRALAAKVRDGSIAPAELDGGTFTVSNLGMFGVTGFTAVVNPPQAAILAVGAMRRMPVVDGDAVVIRQRMEIALTCDHRILYGADAARVLARVRELLEEPLSLMLQPSG